MELLDRLLEANRPRAAFDTVHMHWEQVETSRLKRLLHTVGTVDEEPAGHYRLEPYRISEALELLDGRAGAVYRAPRTSEAHPEHRVYPYLLKGLAIERANHVWCADITYIPVRRGFLYLVAIMDWASRHVLAWRLSNTLDAGFCTDALDEALARHGTPEIFNTDQGSQFTGFAFTGRLREAGIRISMDGRGRYLDNIFIERLWRSLKYEAVYLRELADGFEARRVIGEWIDFYNTERPHSALGGKNAGRGLPRRPACGYDGQAAMRLAHIPTGATTTARRSIQKDSGGMNDNRNTP